MLVWVWLSVIVVGVLGVKWLLFIIHRSVHWSKCNVRSKDNSAIREKLYGVSQPRT
jgi:hypothetical protein